MEKKETEVKDEEKKTVEQEQPKKVEPLSLNVLEYILDLQAQHGIRDSNFLQYRQYCSRRIKKIKQKLKCSNGRGKYQERKIKIEEINDVRYLQLLLVKAERAWAFANQLKTENTKNNSRLKLRFYKRLKKATNWSEELVNMANKVANPRTQLESQAYSAWMKGSLLLVKGVWLSALNEFIRSRTIYDQLSKVGKSKIKEMYSQRIATKIDPPLRFCDYNLKTQNKESTNDEDVVEMIENSNDPTLELLKSKLYDVLEETRKNQTKNLDEIVFNGKVIPVSNDKLKREIINSRKVLNNIKNAKTHESKLKYFDRLLISYSDASKILRDDIKTKTELVENAGFMENYRVLNTYLTYLTLSGTIERNLIIIESLEASQKKDSIGVPNSIVRLFESILLNLTEIEGLPGFSENGDLYKEIKLKEGFYKVKRCYYLALSYKEANKWNEASALIKLCEKLHFVTEKLHGKSTKELEELKKLIRVQKCTLRANYLLEKSNVVEEVKKDKIEILEDLNNYSIDRKGKPLIISFPPKFEALSCRPLFFDVAVKSIKYPDFKDKEEKKGWFSSFW